MFLCYSYLRTRLVFNVLFVCLMVVASPGHAHQQWLAPNFFVDSRESAWLSFDHTFGDRRFQPDSGPGNYYHWWVVGPDGLRRPVPSIFVGKTRTVGEIELENAGTYRLEGEEDLMAWTQIKIDDKEAWYPGNRARFEGAEIIRSRLYFNKAIAYVTLGKSTGTALAPANDPLEIVFMDHPNELREGNSFQVKAMAYGKPLAGQEIRMYGEEGSAHDEASVVCTTDIDGLCRLKPPAMGRFLLVTTTEGDYPKAEETDGYSNSVSVLVEVSKQQ